MADEASPAPLPVEDTKDQPDKLQIPMKEHHQELESTGTNGDTLGLNESLDEFDKTKKDAMASDISPENSLYVSATEFPDEKDQSQDESEKIPKETNGQSVDDDSRSRSPIHPADEVNEVVDGESSQQHVDENEHYDGDKNASDSVACDDETDAVPYSDPSENESSTAMEVDNTEQPASEPAAEETSQDMDVSDIIRNIDELSGSAEPLNSQPEAAQPQFSEEAMESETEEASATVEQSDPGPTVSEPKIPESGLDDVDSTLPSGDTGEVKDAEDEQVETQNKALEEAGDDATMSETKDPSEKKSDSPAAEDSRDTRTSTPVEEQEEAKETDENAEKDDVDELPAEQLNSMDTNPEKVEIVSGPIANTADSDSAPQLNMEPKEEEVIDLDEEQDSKEKTVSPKGSSKDGDDPKNELKDYATDTVDEFLGIMGMDKLDAKEKADIDVSSQLATEPDDEKKEEKSTSAEAPANNKSESAESKEDIIQPEEVKPDKSTKATTPTRSVSTDSKDSKTKPPQQCIVCKKVGKCKYNIVRNGDIKHLCDDSCFKVFRANPTTYLRGKDSSSVPAPSNTSTTTTSVATTPQPASTGNCSFCSIGIPAANATKFGLTVGKEKNYFCGTLCRDEYKKRIKLCAFCNKNISRDPSRFMAPVKGPGRSEFRDFCSQVCHQKFENKSGQDGDVQIVGTSKVPQISRVTRATSGQATCAVCGKMAAVKHEVNYDGKVHKLCGDPCFAAFRYANKLSVNTCENCGVYCHNEGMTPQTIQFEGTLKRFCSINCVNSFKNGRKKITACAWCNTKKSNFDMIERVDANNKYQLFCSLNCLSLYRVNLQATSNQNVACDHCHKVAPAQYHLTMSDASVRNFCSYNCVMAFQAQFTAPKGATPAKRSTTPAVNNQNTTQTTPPQTTTAVRQSPRQAAKVAQAKQQQQQQQKGQVHFPIISSVQSLASAGQTPSPVTRGKSPQVIQNTTPVAVRQATRKQPAEILPLGTTSGTQTVTQQVIVKPPPPKQVKNKLLLVKPFTQTKATSCKPHTQTKETQTDEEWKAKPTLIPVPVPIYIPTPMAMYTTPAPYPLPIPVPIPVPCFIPTTKKSADSILRHIKEIQERIPADPFEAELLMMAEAVEKAEKGSDESSDESDNEEPPKSDAVAGNQTPVSQQQSEAEDMLQMAMRIATEMPEEHGEQQLDLENSLVSMPINPEIETKTEFGTIEADTDIITASRDNVSSPRGRRGGKRRGRGGGGRPKRQRVEEAEIETTPATTPTLNLPAPDANMVLKYTYGVNAWKHWVLGKNLQLEKASSGRSKLKMFKTDILQCTADELNFSLCLFVKEVRKPNGDEYAPDSIYYLCLGIQQYLFENGRIDNIFTDFYYEKFTECLNEVLQRYEVRLNEAGMIVCRIEEEHLWESKQLGAHSPHVLLNTLVYFNTKFFMLKTTDDHLNLSFSHIMKHWKKTNIPGAKTPGRSVYLRYYAPGISDGGRKAKREETPVYEQGENVDNPLRCPVKLYEFYLSKCPESIKNRNDVFYLVPERSCVPDSPVWYSTASLGGEAMSKMLNRVRLVREIQEAALHTHPMYVS